MARSKNADIRFSSPPLIIFKITFKKNIVKKFNYIKGSALLISMLILGSCNKDIMDYSDPNAKNEQSFFNTPQEIEQGAFAIYSSFFHNNGFTWELPEVFDGLANEFDGRPSSSGEAGIQTIRRYEHNNSNDEIKSFWRLLYRMILRSNLVIYKGGQYLETIASLPFASRYWPPL